MTRKEDKIHRTDRVERTKDCHADELREDDLDRVSGGATVTRRSGPGDEGPEESITFVYGK